MNRSYNSFVKSSLCNMIHLCYSMIHDLWTPNIMLYRNSIELSRQYFSLKIVSIRPLVMSVYQKNNFLIFSTDTYVLNTQKNRLNETVLLSIQTFAKNYG